VTAAEIETVYRGYVPDLTPGAMAAYVAVVMEPTGEMKPCVQVGFAVGGVVLATALDICAGAFTN
jgi:hypothetical protein